MNQYFDHTTNKYHLTLEVEIPKYLPSRTVNFRIFSITDKSFEIIRDPQLLNSKYIFEMYRSLFGKKVFFNFSFDKYEFEKIRSFNFGLCEEGVRWILKDIIFENIFFKEEEFTLINYDYYEDALAINSLELFEEKNSKNTENCTPEIITDSLKVSLSKEVIKKEESNLKKSNSSSKKKSFGKKQLTR